MHINFLKSVLRLHMLSYCTELWLDFMKNITFGLESIFVWSVPLQETLFLVWYICGTSFCRTVFLFLNMRNVIGFELNKT